MLTADFSTHRPLAWGVLGLAIGGSLFSLLTLLFSGVVPGFNPLTLEKFRRMAKIFCRLKFSGLYRIGLALPLQSDPLTSDLNSHLTSLRNRRRPGRHQLRKPRILP